MSDFIDAFVIGDGEDVLIEFLDVYSEAKGGTKNSCLKALGGPRRLCPLPLSNRIPPDGLVKSITPL
jgi:hypothetical protein